MNICSIFKVPLPTDLSNKYFRFILRLDPRRWCVEQAQSPLRIYWTLFLTNSLELHKTLISALFIKKRLHRFLIWNDFVVSEYTAISKVRWALYVQPSTVLNYPLNKENTVHLFFFQQASILNNELSKKKRKKKHVDVSLNIVLISISLYVNGSN